MGAEAFVRVNVGRHEDGLGLRAEVEDFVGGVDLGARSGVGVGQGGLVDGEGGGNSR